ncbi:MAG: hypothetical protein JRJ10_08205 [Deltaproteobacteria bacterium]|nr:hypothetical protein [Deltaproteobacteria bacterium]
MSETQISFDVAMLATPHIDGYAGATRANWQAYCDRHGYEFTCWREAVLEDMHLIWSKIELMRRHMREMTADWLVVVDADGRLFDEDFFMYGEDVLLTWKARQRGFEVVCADAVTVEHEGSASAPHGDYFYEYHVTRGHWILGRKLYGDLWDRASTRLCRYVYLVIRAVLRSLRFRNLVAFRALRLAIRS